MGLVQPHIFIFDLSLGSLQPHISIFDLSLGSLQPHISIFDLSLGSLQPHIFIFAFFQYITTNYDNNENIYNLIQIDDCFYSIFVQIYSYLFVYISDIVFFALVT